MAERDFAECEVDAAGVGRVQQIGDLGSRSSRRRRSATVEWSVATTLAQASELEPEWKRLFDASGTKNPFAHPDWLVAWAEVYVPDGDLCVLGVRRDGELVAAAPFYRIRVPGRGRAVVEVLRPLGIGKSPLPLTEVPEVLTVEPHEPKLLALVVRGLLEHAGSWDWLELTLTPQQGWLDPEWIAPLGKRPPAAVFHKRTRACVVLSLAPTWEASRAALGRNVRESIRRGENRLRRHGHTWDLVDRYESPQDVDAALSELARLHAARAASVRGPRHPNYLAGEAQREFLRRATMRLTQTDAATPAVLVVDDDIVAARLLLHAGGETFFSISGFDPNWWDYGVATTLMSEALRRRIERGDTSANLAAGPERSKLRWSRDLRLHEDFILVRNQRRSRLAFGAFWTMRAATHVYRHRLLNTPLK
jgi:CelD/BcsL family acetyltransferase involved in cellulose biosynthesis